MNEKQKSSRNRPGLPDLEFHQRNCIVCKHPDRAAIEEDYLHWHSPENIGGEFKINYRSIYRHAHATGLYDRRRRNLRCVLDTFLENAEHVRITARKIISAVRTYARINDNGDWVEPPTTNKVLVERTTVPAKRPIASGHIEERTPPTTGLSSRKERSNGTQETSSDESAPPVSVALATDESDENVVQPVNQSQTEIDVTHSK